ncbi:hypothetical protein BZA05DRAFT_468081 [Tricharina praecox]|uniref:uncharacterized protein n=1 Tax=Tricharina praecox TaxID=43433 RepID=UPI00221FBE5B|nr:uncharacterized protein BZA05DRAFT_468081 [Tricharina praecox]KAI5854447.1 hypothetical protein BZA05DRAFT_468081 [Tricharina praecox]
MEWRHKIPGLERSNHASPTRAHCNSDTPGSTRPAVFTTPESTDPIAFRHTYRTVPVPESRRLHVSYCAAEGYGNYTVVLAGGKWKGANRDSVDDQSFMTGIPHRIGSIPMKSTRISSFSYERADNMRAREQGGGGGGADGGWWHILGYSVYRRCSVLFMAREAAQQRTTNGKSGSLVPFSRSPDVGRTKRITNPRPAPQIRSPRYYTVQSHLSLGQLPPIVCMPPSAGMYYP